jgi:hypothetical protein
VHLSGPLLFLERRAGMATSPLGTLPLDVLDQILQEALLVDGDNDTRAFPYVRSSAWPLAHTLGRSLAQPIRSVLYRHIRLEAYAILVRLAASLHRTRRGVHASSLTLTSSGSRGSLVRTISLVLRTHSATHTLPRATIWHLLALFRACPHIVGLELEFLDLDLAALLPTHLLAFGLRTLNRLTHVAIHTFPDVTDFVRYKAIETLRSATPALRRLRLGRGKIWPETTMPPVPPTAVVPLVVRNANLVEVELLDVDMTPHVLARWLQNLPLQSLLLRPLTRQPEVVLAAVSNSVVHLNLALRAEDDVALPSSLSQESWKTILASFPRLRTLVIDGIFPSPVHTTTENFPDNISSSSSHRRPGIRLTDLPSSLTKLSLSFCSWEAAPSEVEWLEALQDPSWLPVLSSLVVAVDDPVGNDEIWDPTDIQPWSPYKQYWQAVTTGSSFGSPGGSSSSSSPGMVPTTTTTATSPPPYSPMMQKLWDCLVRRNIALHGRSDFVTRRKMRRMVARPPVITGPLGDRERLSDEFE